MTQNNSDDSGTNRPRRPRPQDHDSYQEFYKAVLDYLVERSEGTAFNATEHVHAGNELVRICPHCDAPAIISISSTADDPSWRCVGKYKLSDKHHFTRVNVPEERLNTQEEAGPEGVDLSDPEAALAELEVDSGQEAAD